MQKLRFSENRRGFVTADGKPFVWIADTAWTLPARLKWDDVNRYMTIRSRTQEHRSWRPARDTFSLPVGDRAKES